MVNDHYILGNYTNIHLKFTVYVKLFFFGEMYNTAAFTVNMQQVRSRYWDIENKVELKPNKSYKVHTTQIIVFLRCFLFCIS